MMNNNRTTVSRFLAVLALPFALASCGKTGEEDILDQVKPIPVVDKTVGVYVLNEGSMGAANSSITYYDMTTGKTDSDVYKKVNGRDLGDGANDLKRYGSKMYCVVSGDFTTARSFVIVMDVKTGKVVKEISFNENGKGIMPRSIAFSGSKAYVSAYNGSISRIDTATLLVDKTVTAGTALEGMAIANGKIYVANTENTYTVPGSLGNKTLSVVRLEDMTKLKEVEVGPSPTHVQAGPDGTILVAYAGVYGVAGSGPGAVKLSAATDARIITVTTELNSLAFTEDLPLVIGGAYTGPKPFIAFLNYTNLTKGADFIKDQTALVNPYGLTINPFDKSVLISDAKAFGSTSGEALYFTAGGKKLFSFPTGMNPQKAVFVYSYK
ncbi:hypothetical protein C7T94_10200 [Pedobacter yulinensis]|uniref:Uncharacterized protein n=1 Tax=Pedobacter yulinensis TaxID=2126353 RepID=A0A2T3HKN7_9SPHI|nr:DUF5074 domain-containing protein [Pedobacter yulinensis]PST82990.1 hypothetical protein C7T94_10200 [Pedobacter yulinensis]